MKRIFLRLKQPLRNERGEITFFACFFVVGIVMLISFLLLYASIRITCINIRNGAKMELNNLSGTIYADTYRSQRETNFEEYLNTLYSSSDYTDMLEATVAGVLDSKIPLSTEDYKVSNISLVGSSPDNIRHFLELRGIGIINARRLFGIGAVKNTEKIELIVEMEQWNPEKIYDRMGVDTQFATILGVKIPMLTIPVKPGRNLAVILEVAAMNNRQKKMGYNAATELLDQLGLDMESKEVVKDHEAF